MSKVQWESDLTERPFFEQLKALAGQWIEGVLRWRPSPISQQINRFWHGLRWLTKVNIA
jgi:hypothetical protein